MIKLIYKQFVNRLSWVVKREKKIEKQSLGPTLCLYRDKRGFFFRTDIKTRMLSGDVR